ncbi:MAG: hypothetical protein IT366_06345 [Candidatus Hydrogenedentes bacterium]|nr:hypothetical protein [Candidatus Hydrogenedentota bacterium]
MIFNFADAHDAFYRWIGEGETLLADQDSVVTIEGHEAVCKFIDACPQYEAHRDALITAHGARRFQLTYDDWKSRLGE